MAYANVQDFNQDAEMCNLIIICSFHVKSSVNPRESGIRC